jgi:hypothetical protein
MEKPIVNRPSRKDLLLFQNSKLSDILQGEVNHPFICDCIGKKSGLRFYGRWKDDQDIAIIIKDVVFMFKRWQVE